MQSLCSLGRREAGQGSRCREAALAASCGKGGHERCSGSAEGGGTASGTGQLSKKGSAKLLGPRAGPWREISLPSSLSFILSLKIISSSSRKKQKVFGCPVSTARCRRRMSCSLGVPSPMAARDRAGTGLAQVRTQTQLSWHSQTTTWAAAPCTHSLGGEREWPHISQAAPLYPEALKCTGVIILFFLFPD